VIDRLLLALAQGFGVGCIRTAPGTFGSGLGLLWFLALAGTRNFGIFVAGALGGIAVSVWVCGAAERILDRKDPPSVVLDEIIALPLCFAGWVTRLWLQDGRLPAPAYFLTGASLWVTGIFFVAFRVVDILKPWPVGAAQRLPGGWGVTMDDVLAALYVNVAVAAGWMLIR
jgi:phosphatidylglycerophosphatase A